MRKPDHNYASRSALGGSLSKITMVMPNAKIGKSHARYEKYRRIGETVGGTIAMYKADGLSETLAWDDLCWDLKHGLIAVQVK